MTWPQTLLMVHPEHFTVEYIINPHMADENGAPKKVDHALALKQWENLKSKFEELGMDVDVLPGAPGLPDMVFCANQTFPFIKDGNKHVLLSRMQSPQRQPEVAYFKKWAQEKNFTIHELTDGLFEGMGDALWDYETGRLFAGYGFRTSPEIYQKIETLIGQKITTFELKNPHFYHLDTCLALIGQGTAAYVREAFTEEGLQTLEASFDKLLQVPLTEATQGLAGNMCSPNGKDVVLHPGATQTNALLKAAGFNVHEVDTSEYLKSGGSVFCMKQMLF